MELESHPFFQKVASEQIQELREAAVSREYPPGTIIFEEGSQSDSLYLVLEGEIAFKKQLEDGEFRTISTAREGDFFGEIGVFTGGPRALRAESKSKVVMAEVPADALAEYLRNVPGPMKNIVRSIISHLNETTRHYVEDMLHQERMAVVGNMVNTIVHDFKNPFCIISLGAQMIEQYHDDEKTRRLCRNIEEQIQRMLGMAEELGEFSRGRQSLVLSDISLPKLMERFREMNFPYFDDENIEIEINVPEATLRGEEDKLLRVTQNLVGNAIDAFEDGRGRIAITGEILSGNKVELRIADNGQGIPESIRGRFFEPFVTHGKKRGTGLGTAIAKSIIEAHGGNIRFETETGKGTTFHVQLPLAGA